VLKSVRIGKDQWTSSGIEKRESVIEGLVEKFWRKRESVGIGKDQWTSSGIGNTEGVRIG
jgi:hypothetical protein